MGGPRLLSGRAHDTSLPVQLCSYQLLPAEGSTAPAHSQAPGRPGHSPQPDDTQRRVYGASSTCMPQALGL